MHIRRSRLAQTALLGLALCWGPVTAGAAEPDAKETPSVNIEGVRSPEMRSYRAVIAGLDAFDEYHQQLAPAAPGLKFRALVRGAQPAIPEGLALRIAGDDESYPVPVSADGTFSVPRIEAAYASDADLVFNRKRHSFRIDAEIRTDGLPENVRRLGDLRLQCRVAVAIGKKELRFWQVAMVNTLMMTGDWCSKLGTRDGSYMKDADFHFMSLSRLAGATLRDGERTMNLKVDRSGYLVPLGDISWPNDALVELTYAAQ